MVENAELAAKLRECQKKGAVSNELLRLVESIAMNLLRNAGDRMEIIQNVLLKFCKVFRRIRANGNVFAYVTQMVKNVKKNHMRGLRRYNARFIPYYDSIIIPA